MMDAGQALVDWLTDQQRQTHKIWLEEPEVVKEGGMLSKSFVRYTICHMQDKGKLVRVKHRYSEFEMVQTALVGMYAPLGLLVPAIPGKKLVNNQSNEFILSRMRGLTIFCEQVMQNPYLRNDNLWKEFLNPNTSGFTKDTIFAATSTTSMGSLRWLETVDRSMTPAEPSLKIDQLVEECNHTEKNMKGLADALRSYYNNMRAVNNSIASINNALLQWVDDEGDAVTALNGAWTPATAVPEIEQPKTNLTSAAQLFSAHHAATSKVPDAGTFLVLDMIEYHIAQIQDLRDMSKIRNDYENSIEKLSNKLQKLEQADGSKWEQLTEVRQQLQDKSEGLLKFYRGFFNHALPEYVVERATAVRDAMATLGLMSLAPAANLQAAGQTFFKQMCISPSTQFQAAVVTLDRLGLPPIDEFPMVVPAEEVRLTAPPPPESEVMARPQSGGASPSASGATTPVVKVDSARTSDEEQKTAIEEPAQGEDASPAAGQRPASLNPSLLPEFGATDETPTVTTPSRKNEIMADLLKDSKYDTKSDLWD